jgi:membrane associated rhomboid family serine protease
MIEYLALWSYSSGLFYPWQLLTYGFLHSPNTFSHIMFNMFALWMFGSQIEDSMGSKRFLTYYLACVIGAGVVQLIFSYVEGTIYPTLGASGGVFGLLLAFGMMFPEQSVYLMFLPIPIKAKWFVVGYGLIELMNGVFYTNSNVAHFAHLGGMLFGFLMILYWRGKLPLKPKTIAYF